MRRGYDAEVLPGENSDERVGPPKLKATSILYGCIGLGSSSDGSYFAWDTNAWGRGLGLPGIYYTKAVG